MYAAPDGISILQHISDGSQPIAISNSLDKSVEFFGDLDMLNFYNGAEVDTSIADLNLVNYYTKNQVDALIPNINLVDYYTNAEIDSQLTDYTTITYLQGNYLTTLSITRTLMNNYATITLLADSFYGETYLDNQFSSKAYVLQFAELVTTDYLIAKISIV